MAYTKKQKKLIRHVLGDLLSKVDGFLYKDPQIVGETNAVMMDELTRESIIKSYTDVNITVHN